MFARFTTKKEARSLVTAIREIASPTITIIRVPEVAYIKYAMCDAKDASALWTFFKAKQHEYGWDVRGCYDLDTARNVGVIFFNVPTRKSGDELDYVAQEQGLRVRTIFNS